VASERKRSGQLDFNDGLQRIRGETREHRVREVKKKSVSSQPYSAWKFARTGGDQDEELQRHECLTGKGKPKKLLQKRRIGKK